MRNLRQHIEVLEQNGELIRIASKVDTVEEICEITDRVVKSGGKALLFERTDKEFAVVTNLFGSRRRMEFALGIDSFETLEGRIETFFDRMTSSRKSFFDKLRTLPMLLEIGSYMPRKSCRRGECQQVVLRDDEVDLSIIPALKCWSEDGGRFITLPLVHTISADKGVPNVGMYRIQIYDDQSAGLHWHKHKTGERHYQSYKNNDTLMPVAIAVGGDPIYSYCATAPLPEGVDEYLMAGFIRKKRVKLVKCITHDIYVPSDCDFVIEGYVDPSEELTVEGPFGDHTGFYSLQDLYPKLHVTAITHRRDAIYPATIVGVPPQEDLYLAEATEKIFLAPIRLALQPEVKDLYMPLWGVAHNIALVHIDNQYSSQAFKVASSMWGAGQMMFNKFMVVADVPVRCQETIAQRLRDVDISRDVLISKGVLDVLDHAAEHCGEGGKMALDLTAVRQPKRIVVPETFKMVDGVVAVDSSLAHSWGVVVLRSESGVKIDIASFIEKNGVEGVNYFVIFDTNTSDLSHGELLWVGCANVDVGRDVESVSGCLVFDCRAKLSYVAPYPARFPNVVTSSLATIELVDRRWAEYGIGDFVVSPSVRYRKLIFNDKAQV